MTKITPENKQRFAQCLQQIHAISRKPLTIMEVCGTHTMNIARYGIRGLLPQHIRLLSGPGCPVCVTDEGLIQQAMQIAKQPDVILTTFGDLMRVPAGQGSLQSCREAGCDIRIVLSPLDALQLAKESPKKDVVFFAVGFETTAPLTAVAVSLAAEQNISNFFVLCGHKTMPQAICALLRENTHINGLLAPGHVAAITGSEMFTFLSTTLDIPVAISGFAPWEILTAILAIVQLWERNQAELINCYPSVVTATGNPTAKAYQDRVFTTTDVCWRGLGILPNSGLVLRPEYGRFSAENRFTQVFREITPTAPNGCCCGAILQGKLQPKQCPLFSATCRPDSPVGPCMVSGEGACAAAYRYERKIEREETYAR